MMKSVVNYDIFQKKFQMMYTKKNMWIYGNPHNRSMKNTIVCNLTPKKRWQNEAKKKIEMNLT
jgi:hypothetical protein